MSQALETILKQLKKSGSVKNLAGMQRFGIATERAFGVPHPALHAIARQHRKDHALALELWASGYHEARLLAAFIDDPKQVTAAQMDAWVRDFNSWDICDTVTGKLFERTEFAFDKAYEWTRSKREFVRRAGLAMMAWLAVHRKKEPDKTFLDFFPAIEAVAADERNFVKKASSWALRQLGKRSAFLNKHAVRSAKRVGKLDSRAARWLAADVLREITSEKVQARLGGEKMDAKGIQREKALLAYLSAKPGSAGSYPFGPGALVFKVGGKMFALVGDDERPLTMNLKCDPDEALALRAAHPKAITPGYHMNKRHWNTVLLDGSLPDSLVKEMIDHSYGLVFRSLPKDVQGKIKAD